MDDLIVKGSVSDIIAKRDESLRLIRDGLDILEQAQRHYQTMPLGQSAPNPFGNYYRDGGLLTCTHERARAEIDAGVWLYLAEACGLKNLMDAKAWKQFREGLDVKGGRVKSSDIPEVTTANVESTFKQARENAPDIMERGIVAAFDGLSRHYKSNEPFKLGKKIVLSGVMSITKWRGDQGQRQATNCYGVSHYRAQEVDDMARAFYVVQGLPVPDHTGQPAALIKLACRQDDWRCETPYFSAKWHKNGNLHLTFKDMEAVERVNAIIAKHHPRELPDGRRGTAGKSPGF